MLRVGGAGDLAYERGCAAAGEDVPLPWVGCLQSLQASGLPGAAKSVL